MEKAVDRFWGSSDDRRQAKEVREDADNGELMLHELRAHAGRRIDFE